MRSLDGPRTIDDDAVNWSRWILSKGQTVGVGLTQLNIDLAAWNQP